MSTTKYTPKKKRKPIFEQKKGDLDNLNNPMIFLVSHNFQPGMQLHVSAFEKEEDAAFAALAVIKERWSQPHSPKYNYSYEEAFEKFGKGLISEWHSVTRHMERIDLFKCPINIYTKGN